MKNTDSYYFIAYVLEAAAILDEGAQRGWSGLRLAHRMGLVSAANHRDQSHRVNWPFLPQNLVAGTKVGPCD